MPAVAVPFVGFLSSVGVGAGTAAFIGNAILATGGFVFNTALALGVNTLISRVMRPKVPGQVAAATQERQASVLNLAVGEGPREAIFGRAATGGQLVDAFTYGGTYKTDWLVQVIALADHRCDALEGVFVGDQYVAFGGTGEVPGHNGQFVIDWLPGTADQALPEWFLNASAESFGLVEGEAWTPADNLAGVSAVLVARKADAPDAQTPVWSGGLSDLVFVVRGKLCYDPRLDSTVGGSGAHLWSDPTTWTWSENAKVCHYNWQRGVYACDLVDQPEMLLVGRGLSDLEAPPQRVFAAANLCDEDCPTTGDGIEPRYRVGGVVRSNETYEATEQAFAAAMGGFLTQPAGGIDVEPGQSKAAVAAITDDDLVVGAPVSFEPFKSDAARINTVIPRYVEPAQRWADHAADICRDLTDVATDGGVREESLPLSLVTSRFQAKRLGDIYLRGARLERTATIVLGPRFAKIESGDWITWTSARRGMTTPVTFRVTGDGLGADWRNTLTLAETAADVYGFGDLATNPFEAGAPPPPDALQLAGVTAEAIEIEGSTGSLVPAIRFGWTIPVDPAINRIRAEVRLSGETQVSPTVHEGVNDGALLATNGVAPNRTMQARLVPLGPKGRPIVPSPWLTVSTGSLIADNVRRIANMTAAEAYSILQDMSGRGGALRADLDRLGEAMLQGLDWTNGMGKTLEALAYEGDSTVPFKTVFRQALNVLEEADQRTLRWFAFMGAADENGQAWVFDLDKVQLTPTESLAQRLTSISAGLGANSAAISQESTARANATGALASQIENVSTTVGAHTASLTQFAESINGLNLRWGVALDIDGRISGLVLNGGASFTGFSVIADVFTISDPNSPALASFAVVDGIVVADNLAVGHLVADTIEARHIKGGAVTAVAALGSSGTFETTGGPLLVNCYCAIGATTSVDTGCVVALRLDGADVGYFPVFCRGNWGEDSRSKTFKVQPPPGVRSFELVRSITGGSGPQVQHELSMIITELKR